MVKQELRIVSHVLSHDCPVDWCVFPITALCSPMNDFLATDERKSNNKVPWLGVTHSITHSFTYPQRAGLALVGQWTLNLVSVKY
jgi:hypothetical protein